MKTGTRSEVRLPLWRRYCFCLWALEYWRPQALQRVLGPVGPDLHSGVVEVPQEVHCLLAVGGGECLYALLWGL